MASSAPVERLDKLADVGVLPTVPLAYNKIGV